MLPLNQPQLHEYDTGTRFVITVKQSSNTHPGRVIDLSLALQVFLRFRRPDRTYFDVEASLIQPDDSTLAPGEDGRIEYYTTEDDLTPPGAWTMQALILLPSGTWSSSVYPFTVFPNLVAT